MKKWRQKGFTMVELMVVLAISSFMLLGIFGALLTGQAAWFSADASMELREGVRSAAEKISRELRESGFDAAAVYQVTIGDGTGVNGTDTLRFSMPVLCNSAAILLNASGDIAYWGAPLTWGCTTSSCMDADNVCATVDYKYVQYEINASNQLIRKVLNPALAVVRQDIITPNMIDIQVTKSADQNVVTVQLTAQKQSGMHRMINLTKSVDVFLRNRG